MSAQITYQWYAELEDFRPKMWRRFQTIADITVEDFAYIVMALFEMNGDHLFSIENVHHLITASGKKSKKKEVIGRYIVPMDDGWDDGDDVADFKVSDLTLDSSSYLSLWYDFGDDWKVRIKLEKKLDADETPGNKLPCVLEGAGFGIIEDCGGPFRLEDIAEAFKEKEGENYEYFREWFNMEDSDEDLDLETFNIDDMNRRLKKMFSS